MPMLCVGGALRHPCDLQGDGRCPAEYGGCPQDTPDHPRDSGCGHEPDCGSDPCSITLVQRDPSSDSEALMIPQPLVHVESVADVCGTSLVVPWSFDAAAVCVQIPFHLDDVPLLL